MNGNRLAHKAAIGTPISSISISISDRFSFLRFCVQITSLEPQSKDFFIPALRIRPSFLDKPDAWESCPVNGSLPKVNQLYIFTIPSWILPLRVPFMVNPKSSDSSNALASLMMALYILFISPTPSLPPDSVLTSRYPAGITIRSSIKSLSLYFSMKSTLTALLGLILADLAKSILLIILLRNLSPHLPFSGSSLSLPVSSSREKFSISYTQGLIFLSSLHHILYANG